MTDSSLLALLLHLIVYVQVLLEYYLRCYFIVDAFPEHDLGRKLAWLPQAVHLALQRQRVRYFYIVFIRSS